MQYNEVQVNTLVEQAMEQIKNQIISGGYKVGDKLPTENELARTLGISRSSLREAIKVFNYLGVLKSYVAKGTYICDRSNISAEALSWAALLGENDVREVLEMQASIELWCSMQLGTQAGSNDDQYAETLEKLEAQVSRLKLAFEIKDTASMISADLRFHQVIVKSCNNKTFGSIYDTLHSFSFQVSSKVSENLFRQYEIIFRLHQTLLKAIRDGDLDHISKVCRDHFDLTLMLFNYPLIPPE